MIYDNKENNYNKYNSFSVFVKLKSRNEDFLLVIGNSTNNIHETNAQRPDNLIAPLSIKQ